MTKLIGVVQGPTLAAVIDQMSRAESFADLYEIRLDCLDSKAISQLSNLPRKKPLIFTFRKFSQGESEILMRKRD